MRFKAPLWRGLGKNRKAVSPAISTVILTAAIVTLLLVTIVFANTFLTARMAENEFSAMKQFMQTVGLQMDDVAWIPGRAQTIRYASRYGQVKFVPNALTYIVNVSGGSLNLNAAYTTGILTFDMPVSSYSLGNNYYERILPASGKFLNNGTSAPVGYVFIVENLTYGNYIRIVVVPCIRVLNSAIGGKNYYKFYLPILESGNNSQLSQSVTLFGESVSVKTGIGNTVNITVTFPEGQGFDYSFFNFKKKSEILSVPQGSIIEFYTAKVNVSLGLHG